MLFKTKTPVEHRHGLTGQGMLVGLSSEGRAAYSAEAVL